MTLKFDTETLDNLIVVGDRVLIRPKNPEERTKSGLILPPGVHEKQKVQSGYVIKVGPGYPIPVPGEQEEPWQKNSDSSKYFPLQAQMGDLAVYIQDSGTEIELNNQKYVVVPFQAILLLLPDEGLFE